MAKYYLYLLLAIFIFLNGVEYFEQRLRDDVKKYTILKYKLDKQKLYSLHSKEIKRMLKSQNKIVIENNKLFFNKNTKETIIFSKIQGYIQSISKDIGGKINRLDSGTVIKTDKYIKYPISLEIKLIPEDLDKFLKKIYKSEKYLYIDSLYISSNKRERILLLKITLSGYQFR